jgi:SNF2 family DNA or RNA helicase
MDQLAPGVLDTMADFRKRYETPDDQNMAELYGRVFQAQEGLAPLALRRLKDTVARDLPTKTRRLHPRLMPEAQSLAYEDARLKLASRKPGAALKVLHHPSLHEAKSDSEFIAISARLQATLDILKTIAQKGERALVFIEHRQMQYRFIALVKAAFGLERVDLINGDTPIKQRQIIVNRFQEHQVLEGGFDLLVLGPKAAGTGLTLTAATHVIHLSRWWNPAVEEQCNDRVHRLGQTKDVSIHLPMAIHPHYREQSFDCLLHSLMQRKRRLASSALWPMGDTESDVGELQKMLEADVLGHDKSGDAVKSALAATFARDGVPEPVYSKDGSIVYG